MKTNNQLKFSLPGIIEILVISLSILCIVSSTFHSFRLFELASHFKFQYFCGSLFFFCLFAVRRKKIASLWFLFLLLYNLYFIIPWYIQPQGRTNLRNTLKLLHSNVYTKNKEWSKFIALIETENPNIIVTQEVNNKWINHLSVIEKKYPFNVKLPRSDNFGMAVYSKFPIVKKVDLTTDRFAIPTISITIQIENKNIEIISMHPLPPINNEYFNSRNKQINFIANYCKNAETPIILIGDLNTSLWSKYYTHLENLSKLHNTRRGFGILPSWPANIFPFRIPIDHCMVSPEFDVINTKLGTNINSDHLPLIVTLKF